MENKTTIELLTELGKLEKLEKENENNDKYDWDEHYAEMGEIGDELITRQPFSRILGENDSVDFTLEERIEELEEVVKKLKRHKHDDKTNDVVIRI